MTFLLLPIEVLLFNFIFKGIQWAVKMVLKAIVYSPQLITSYIICKPFFSKKDTGAFFAAMILLVAIVIYVLIFFLKAIMISMKEKGNSLWLLLFITIVSYTCIFPVWICFGVIADVMKWIDKDHASLLTWLTCCFFACHIYSRYQLLGPRRS